MRLKKLLPLVGAAMLSLSGTAQADLSCAGSVLPIAPALMQMGWNANGCAAGVNAVRMDKYWLRWVGGWKQFGRVYGPIAGIAPSAAVSLHKNRVQFYHIVDGKVTHFDTATTFVP